MCCVTLNEACGSVQEGSKVFLGIGPHVAQASLSLVVLL